MSSRDAVCQPLCHPLHHVFKGHRCLITAPALVSRVRVRSYEMAPNPCQICLFAGARPDMDKVMKRWNAAPRIPVYLKIGEVWFGAAAQP